jgi:hypothetical protein
MAPRLVWQAALLLLLSALTSGTNENPKNGHHFLLSADETAHSAAATAHFHPATERINAEPTRILPRHLQSEEFTPEFVCATFTADQGFNQTFDCRCESYGVDVQMDCDYRQEQCNSDNSICYLGSIQRILELDPEAVEVQADTVPLLARAVTTCTRFTTDDNESVTCIRIFPKKDGDFAELLSCTVQYSPTGEDPQKCNECTLCGTGKQSGLPEISFNCCNRETDLKQTCGSTQNGVAVPVFDIIPESEVGMCTSAGANGRFSLVGAFSFATALLGMQMWLRF